MALPVNSKVSVCTTISVRSGAAENKAALIRQIKTMKEMGCDAIRTAHTDAFYHADRNLRFPSV